MRTMLAFTEAERMLRTRADLLEAGYSERRIRDAVARGELHRVRHGAYVDGPTWDTLWPEGRHLLHVLAAQRAMTVGDSVISHVSAAVWWDLPLYRTAPTHVHVTVPGNAGRGNDVQRHEHPLSPNDVVERHGVRCTSLARTVLDVAAQLGPEAGVACADAALRRVAADGRRYDADAADDWRARLGARAADSRIRGIRNARRVIAFADGRAELPGESVSRLQLHRLGFRGIDLQVRVPGPHGNDYWVDFGLEDVRALGEFDGRGKYLDPNMRSGRELDEVLLREKQREDWIRGVTQRSYARWGYDHIKRPGALAARLAAFGIRPPGR